jgi:hypothetical protein
MSEDSALQMYVIMLDADLALEGRAVVSPAGDPSAVGAVATREQIDRLADAYRARGFRVLVSPETGAIEIRRR